MLHEYYIVMRTKEMPPVSKKQPNLADVGGLSFLGHVLFKRMPPWQ